MHRRARQRLAGHQPRGSASRGRELLERFLAAAYKGDVAGLERMLAAAATSWADGGGKVNAARRPVVGANKVARYLVGLLARFNTATKVTFVEVNGDLAVVGWVDETPLGLFVPQIEGGKVVALRIMANPDKLTYLAGQLSHSEELSGLRGVETVAGRVSNGVRRRLSVPVASVFASGEIQAAGPVTGFLLYRDLSAAGSGVPSGGSVARSGRETENERGGGVSPGLVRQSPVKRLPPHRATG